MKKSMKTFHKASFWNQKKTKKPNKTKQPPPPKKPNQPTKKKPKPQSPPQNLQKRDFVLCFF